MYDGPLPSISNKKEIKFDITIKEKIFYPPDELAVLKNFDEFSDLPTDEKILVYPLLEIAAEKAIALLDRARTEPRDLYDLWFLIEQSGNLSLSDCINAVNAKLLHRGKTLADVRGEFHKKEPRLKKMWDARLALQISTLPEFEGVYRAVKRSMRQAKITED